MAIVVLPRIEQENPFGELAQVISEQALPYLVKLYANKDKIVKLSDTELTDFVEVLQRQAPELVSDGKINWEKVNEWAQSDDPTKLKVASFLFDAKRVREDFANAPLIAKLEIIDVAGSVNPQELDKIFVAGKMQQKLVEAINKSNIPDTYKLLLLSNVDKFADRPELVSILDKVLGGTTTSQQQATEQKATEQSDVGTGSWRFSLDGSKPFRVQLEEPKLTTNTPAPPKPPASVRQTANTRPKTPQKPQPKPEPKTPPSANTPQMPQKEAVSTSRAVSDEITIPSEVPYDGDIKSLFTNKELLGAGADALVTLLALALLRNPQFSVRAPLLLASLKEAGKKAGAGLVSAVKRIPAKIKQGATTLTATGQVSPPAQKQTAKDKSKKGKTSGKTKKQ